MDIKFLIWKYELLLRLSEIKRKRLRRKYCHKGYHKLIKSTHTYWTKNQNKTFEFIACLHCRYRFYASMKQKKEHLKWKQKFNKIRLNSAKETISALLKGSSGTKSKYINSSGKPKSRDVSARANNRGKKNDNRSKRKKSRN